MESLRWLVGLSNEAMEANTNTLQQEQPDQDEQEHGQRHENVADDDCCDSDTSSTAITTDWLVVLDGEETGSIVEVNDLIQQRQQLQDIQQIIQCVVKSAANEDSLIENPLVKSRMSYALAAQPTMEQLHELEQKQDAEAFRVYLKHENVRAVPTHFDYVRIVTGNEWTTDEKESHNMWEEDEMDEVPAYTPTWTPAYTMQPPTTNILARIAAESRYGRSDAMDWCADTRMGRRHNTRCYRGKNLVRL